MARARPSGTVTFLFTDIEASTRLWEEHPEEMAAALARHDEIVRRAIDAYDGYVFSTGGDGFSAAFHTPDGAVAAAVDAQRGLSEETFLGGLDIAVRMGIHTGRAEERDGDYFGPTLNRAARLMASAHGGQVVASVAVTSMVDGSAATWRDLGEHRLKDLATPERVYQLTLAGLASEFAPLRSVDTLPGNLPRQLTSFLGRSQDVADLSSMVVATPMTTLTGVGGVGKTRLALEVAAAVQTEFPEGAWLVELAPVTDPEMVVSAVTGALGLTGPESADDIGDAIRGRKLLLVLDNCEHLLSATSGLVSAMLQRAPRLRILATSREGLGLRGEQLYAVMSLRLDADADEEGAVDLFVDRARSVRMDLELDDETRSTVEELCRRLDGIPLAIELAAARTRGMTPVEILGRIDQRFRLLTGRDRKALERHQTLRGTVDWSYGLLDATEAEVLRRLAVFVGGCDLAAAEAVIAGGDIDQLDVLDQLLSLVDKSLLIADSYHGETRYRLLETIRQYAEEKLAGTNVASDVRRRHAEYYRDLTWAISEQMCGPGEAAARAELSRELPNIQAAVSWAADSGELDIALGTVSSLARPFMTLRGADTALAVIGLRALGAADHALRLDAEAVACWHAYLLGDAERARRHAARIQETADPSPTQRRVVALALGVFDNAGDWMLQEMLQVVDSATEARDGYVAAGSLANCAFAANMNDEPETAAAYARPAVEWAERTQCPGLIAMANWNLGYAVQYSDPALAESAFRTAAERSLESGVDIISSNSLGGLAMVLARLGRLAQAAEYAMKGIAIVTKGGDTLNLVAVLTGAGLVLAYSRHPSAPAIAPASQLVFNSAGTQRVVDEALAVSDAAGIPRPSVQLQDPLELAAMAMKALAQVAEAT